jgi:DNA-binding transcriptional regulator GbsR (MarR family)
LAKKNSAEKKPTAQQVANDGIKTAVLATMANDPNRLFTITELLKAVPNLPEDMSLNRMSALVRQLKDAGKVIRTEDKRKAYFSLAK